MWQTIKRWWAGLLERLGLGRKSLPAPEPPPEPEEPAPEPEEPAPSGLSVLEAMAAMKREKADAEPDWDALRSKLKVKVFSTSDRKRLWRRARRRLGGGEPRDIDDISEPSPEDLQALKGLVEDLARGR
ncbi:MAG: hypothetical protein JRJ84_17505 [Deltaproteobacteria bacterium]|nr:hypothetical protein [Deltaproteobacteria bacterium]